MEAEQIASALSQLAEEVEKLKVNRSAGQTKADENEKCFRKCKFINIRGIRGFQHKIRFEHCSFERNMISYKKGNGNYGLKASWNDKKDYIYIQGKNFTFVDTEFDSCRASKHLLDIEGEVDSCTFKNCSGIAMPCTYLFNFKNSIVTDSVFEKCDMETDSADRRSTYGGLIAVKQGKIVRCSFSDCSSYGASSYGSFAIYGMQILAAAAAEVVGCEFQRCSCRNNNCLE